MRRKGICFVCGCTEADGCPEGCAWANVKQTLCTVCAPLSPKDRKERTAAALYELSYKLEALTDAALEVKTRMAVLGG